MVLSQNNHTPVSYWLSLPLRELGGWIKANNELISEAKKRNERSGR